MLKEMALAIDQTAQQENSLGVEEPAWGTVEVADLPDEARGLRTQSVCSARMRFEIAHIERLGVVNVRRDRAPGTDHDCLRANGKLALVHFDKPSASTIHSDLDRDTHESSRTSRAS
jgi:hypothetical protein